MADVPFENPTPITGADPLIDVQAPSRLLRWTYDQHTTFLAGVFRRATDLNPDGPYPTSSGWRPGLFEAVAAHPVRAVDQVGLSIHANSEVMTFHVAFGLVRVPNGKFAPAFLFKPDLSTGAEIVVLMKAFRVTSANYQGIGTIGKFLLAGSYPTPRWVDALFHSSQSVCCLIKI